jgi:ribonuclease J
MSNNNSNNSEGKHAQSKNRSKQQQKHGQHNQKKRRKPDTAVVAGTSTRRGEVMRASRRHSDLVNTKATQHITDVPVNKSIFNGTEGRQFTNNDLRRANKLPIRQEKTLKVVPLGGLGEMGIGKNMSFLEYENDIIIIDMGMLFPSKEDYPGINYMLPDIKYLEERKHKIRGVIFTHGHLDHIGAAKHLLKKIQAPVYASKFTIGMVERQLSEDPTGYMPQMNVMNPERHDRVQLGESFNVELVRVNHSIPDSTAVVVRTPAGVVINTGDWRFEDDPIDGLKFDTDRLAQIQREEGVLLLMNESTNCEFMHENEVTERDIAESFDDVIGKAEGRVIISAFSSQIHRSQSILEAAKKHNRKVAFAGYSMIQNLEVAIRAGVIKVPKDTIMKMDDIIKLPDNKIVIVGTGSQGELNAVLWRMATGAHRHVKIKHTDTVVFSSNPIPGNDNNVTRTVDGLMREGSQVLQNRIRDFDDCGPLHLSGHGNYPDHVRLLEILKPKFYMPIHGEYHMLVHNGELAARNGVPRDNIFVLDPGDVLEMTKDKAAKTTRVHSGSVMYDNAGQEVSEVVLKDRIHMSTQGMFIVVITVDRATGQLMTSPDIISRGLIYLRDSEELMAKIRRYLKQKVARAISGKQGDLDDVKRDLKDDIAHILFDETQHTPIVIPVINLINSKRPSKQTQPPSQQNT